MGLTGFSCTKSCSCIAFPLLRSSSYLTGWGNTVKTVLMALSEIPSKFCIFYVSRLRCINIYWISRKFDIHLPLNGRIGEFGVCHWQGPSAVFISLYLCHGSGFAVVVTTKRGFDIT